MLQTKLGPLTVRIVGGTDGRGGGDGPVVVLMHGFGASGDDLVGLADMLRVPKSTRFVFPEAPHALPPAMGGYGRMWWPIDMERLARAMAGGPSRDMRSEDPAGLCASRELLLETLAVLRAEWRVPEGGLVLGGFSQGSMLACDVVLRTDTAVDALVVLSGTMLAEDEWREGMTKRAGLPVFQSHGTVDTLLPFDLAKELSTAFEQHDMPTRWVPFRGGHEIPMPVLAELGNYLSKLV